MISNCPATATETEWTIYYLGNLYTDRHYAREAAKGNAVPYFPDDTALEHARMAWRMYEDGVLTIAQKRNEFGEMKYLCRRKAVPPGRQRHR